MKKVLSILLALAMVFCFAACGEKKEDLQPQKEAGVNLTILYEQDDSMINTYTLLGVNPDAPFVDADGKAVSGVKLNTTGAEALINWMLSAEGKEAAKNYGYKEYGEYLFYLLDNAPTSTATIPNATEETKNLRMSKTSYVNDSGLLGYLLPIFE
ncbi:MAG: hypothetical protein Q4E99_02790 [Bacillota bacterium]|nr:hypothetical protein [Bacillota bacterium]